MEKAQNMALESQVPPYLWTKVVNIIVYLINYSPTWANSGAMLEEMFLGEKLNVNHLRFFGYVAYVHIPKEKQNKLESRTLKCLFLGYDDQTKGY